MNLKRILRHLFLPQWSIGLAFPKGTLQAIEQAIAASEKNHDAELRFAVEAGLPLAALTRGQTSRQRAVEVFSQLRVWANVEMYRMRRNAASVLIHNAKIILYV